MQSEPAGEAPSQQRPGSYERYVKPALDRVVAAVLLALAVPALSVIAVAIRVTMGSPILFTQRRVGRGGVDFTVYKFRTMAPDRRLAQMAVDAERRVTHKSPHDPRLTPVGRFLRKWSLDELPQLWNVVRGDMSLVGPRPELVEIVAGYEPWQHRRHAVKPGITGLWQVSARGDRMMHEATDVDLAYIAELSWRNDLRILLLTIPAALGKRTGA